MSSRRRSSPRGLFLLLFAYLSVESGAELSACKFNFGMSWNGPTAAYPAEIDYVTIWAGDGPDFNPYWIGALLSACKPGGKLAGKTPVYYSYIIAFSARAELQLKDCNVGSPNLCEQGANYVRQNKTRILAKYERYASESARIWGTEKPIVWLMEPDYYQYASDPKQEGGPLTYAEAGAYMGDLVAAVRKHLPNAVFSLDISPWTSNPAAWFGAFRMSDFAYVNTSGGGTEADKARIRAVNPMTWKGVRDLTGKPIIADDGYGVAGTSTGHDATWDDVANLNARIGDGVVAITQANAKAGWGATLAVLKPALQGIPGCEPARLASPMPSGRGVSVGSGESLKARDLLGRNQLIRTGRLPFPALPTELTR